MKNMDKRYNADLAIHCNACQLVNPGHINYCHLHAAAPALLEALEGIVGIGKRCLVNEKYDGYFESSSAAIAQAKGENSSR